MMAFFVVHQQHIAFFNPFLRLSLIGSGSARQKDAFLRPKAKRSSAPIRRAWCIVPFCHHMIFIVVPDRQATIESENFLCHPIAQVLRQ